MLVASSFALMAVLAALPGVQGAPNASSPGERSGAPFCTAESFAEGDCAGDLIVRPGPSPADGVPCSIDAETTDSGVAPIVCASPSCQDLPIDTLEPYACVDPSQATLEGVFASTTGAVDEATAPAASEEDPDGSEESAEDEMQPEGTPEDEVHEVVAEALMLTPDVADAEAIIDDVTASLALQPLIQLSSPDAPPNQDHPAAFASAPAPELNAETPPQPLASAPNHLWTLLLLLGVAVAVGLHQWRMFSPLLWP